MSEELLLALLNSTPRLNGVRRDLLAEDQDAWLAEHAEPDVPAGELLAVRDVLRAVVRGEMSPESLAPFLDGVASRPVASANGLEWTRDGDSVAVRAILAWDELRTSAPGRLRPCGNPECLRFLLDRSRANNARWCAMATCGNRMKARRHYERVRGK